MVSPKKFGTPSLGLRSKLSKADQLDDAVADSATAAARDRTPRRGKTEDRNQKSEVRNPNSEPQTRPMLTDTLEGARSVGAVDGC
jgi:hypothetical protein